MIIDKEDIGKHLLQGKFIVCNKGTSDKLRSLYPKNASIDHSVYCIPRIRKVYSLDSYQDMFEQDFFTSYISKC